MTQRGYMNDFYRRFEELNRKLDKANNTIFNLSLMVAELNENNKNKDSSNSSKPSSTNGYKKVITNNRSKSTKNKGGQKNHIGKTLTNEQIENMIKNNEIDEVITIEENKTETNKTLTPIIKYEYDIEIKRKVIKHIIYPDKSTSITRYPVTYGNNIKAYCCLLNQKYMSLDGIQSFFMILLITIF